VIDKNLNIEKESEEKPLKKIKRRSS